MYRFCPSTICSKCIQYVSGSGHPIVYAIKNYDKRVLSIWSEIGKVREKVHATKEIEYE